MATDHSGGGELTDDALRHEIELVGELVVAASASERPLTDEEIDEALGIERGHVDGRSEARGHRVLRRQQA
jgi:hypothetical protein